MRVAFTGASGTGKTTLARAVSEALGLPMCPVGARSVAAEMGFGNPYDVDAAGRRGEFQHRLLAAKAEWEAVHGAFVTDRSAYDNLAYELLHLGAAAAADLDAAAVAHDRYTHVFYAPVRAFQNTGDDPARVQDPAYHRLYDAVLDGLLRAHRVRARDRAGMDEVPLVYLWKPDRAQRLETVSFWLGCKVGGGV